MQKFSSQIVDCASNPTFLMAFSYFHWLDWDIVLLGKFKVHIIENDKVFVPTDNHTF